YHEVGLDREDGLGAPLAQGVSETIEVACAAQGKTLQLQPHALGSYDRLGRNVIASVTQLERRDDNYDPRDAGQQQLHNLEALLLELRHGDGKPRDHAAGPRQRLRPTLADRVAAGDGHDRNRRRRLLRRGQRPGTGGKDDIDVGRDQLGGERRKLLWPALGIAIVEDDVLTRDVAE